MQQFSSIDAAWVQPHGVHAGAGCQTARRDHAIVFDTRWPLHVPKVF